MPVTRMPPDAATQLYLQIAEIRDDAIIMKDGGVRAIIKVEPINFHLKNEDEKNAILISYEGFLNTLNHPLQILIQSRKLNIDNYITDLRMKTDGQTNPLLKRQSEDYIDFVSKLVEVADIMDKEFYVVIPYDEKEGSFVKENFLTKFWRRVNPADSKQAQDARNAAFTDRKKHIESQVANIETALSNAGLSNKRLHTYDLINLFYKTYNPSTSQVEKFEDMKMEGKNLMQ